MMPPAKEEHRDPSQAEKAAMLKERVYVIITALAVLIAVNTHGHEPSARDAAVTLVITVAAILLAGLVADVISHSTVHASLPTAEDLRHLLKVVWGAAGSIAGPLVLLALSHWDVLSVTTALVAGQWWLVLALAFFAFLAMYRMRLGFWRTALLMVCLGLVGVVVIGLQLLAHS